MKKQLLIGIAAFISTALIAQTPTWDWVNVLYDEFQDMDIQFQVDQDQNIFLAGTYKGEDFTFGDTPFPSNGDGDDVYLARLTPQGAVDWVKRIGGSPTNAVPGSGDENLGGMDIDGYNNSIVTGNYNSLSVTFEGSNPITLTGDEGPDDPNNHVNFMYIAKYNALGDVQWAYKYGGTDGDLTPRAIAADGKLDIYVTGSFTGNITLGDYSLSASGSSRDIFVAKFSYDGKVKWAKKAGGSGTDRGQGIAADSEGNCVVTGAFSKTATFSDGLSEASSGLRDIFVIKYNSDGIVQWLKTAGSSLQDEGNDIALDCAGNAYLTGFFNQNATFKDETTPITLSGKASYTEMFTASYDKNGNLSWAIEPDGKDGNNEGKSISVDGNGNTYITGNFSGTVKFDESNTVESNSPDLIVAKYSSKGDFLWLKHVTDNETTVHYAEHGMGISVNPEGYCFVGGYLSNSQIDFADTTVTSNNSYFIGKLDKDGLDFASPCDNNNVIDTTGNFVGVINKDELKRNDIHIHPNPTQNEIFVQGNNISMINIFDCTGRRVKSVQGENIININLEGVNKGIYILQIMDSYGNVRTAIVLKN